jgi:hypothetical protein
MRMRGVIISAMAVALPLSAQFGPRRHTFSIGGGAGVPTAEIGPLVSVSPVLRVGYAYRLHRNFQAETGLDTVFYAARVRDYFQSNFGDLRIRDYEFLLPFGGRALVPVGRDRVLLSAGGGGAYLRYQERVRQPFGNNFRIDCPICQARSGFGYYAILGASVALDRARVFRLGASTRVVRGDTQGDPLGRFPGTRTSDTWVTTAAEFSVTF